MSAAEVKLFSLLVAIQLTHVEYAQIRCFITVGIIVVVDARELSTGVFDSRTPTRSHYFGIVINAHALMCLTRSHGREKRLFPVRVVSWDHIILK